jgi:hypothetical protein
MTGPIRGVSLFRDTVELVTAGVTPECAEHDSVSGPIASDPMSPLDTDANVRRYGEADANPAGAASWGDSGDEWRRPVRYRTTIRARTVFQLHPALQVHCGLRYAATLWCSNCDEDAKRGRVRWRALSVGPKVKRARLPFTKRPRPVTPGRGRLALAVRHARWEREGERAGARAYALRPPRR